MFLDPRYTGFRNQDNRPKAVGFGGLFTTLPDTLFSGGDYTLSDAADCAPGVPVLRLRCRSMQSVPLSCK